MSGRKSIIQKGRSSRRSYNTERRGDHGRSGGSGSCADGHVVDVAVVGLVAAAVVGRAVA